jgi:hypothetical protein
MMCGLYILRNVICRRVCDFCNIIMWLCNIIILSKLTPFFLYLKNNPPFLFSDINIIILAFISRSI